MSPTRGQLGDEEEEEEGDEFGGQETLITRSGRAEAEFGGQDTLVIHEEHGEQGVSGEQGVWGIRGKWVSY